MEWPRKDKLIYGVNQQERFVHSMRWGDKQVVLGRGYRKDFRKYPEDKSHQEGPPRPIGCCMYPVLGIVNGIYTVDDLPDTVKVTYKEQDGELFGPITLTKSGNHYAGPGGCGNAGMFIYVVSDQIWMTYGPCGFEGINICMFYDDLESPPVGEVFYRLKVEDNFAATYTVIDTITGVTTTITRMSQCSWAGGSWTLLYNSTTCKWNLNGNVKTTGHQNIPTGTYGTATVA